MQKIRGEQTYWKWWGRTLKPLQALSPAIRELSVIQANDPINLISSPMASPHLQASTEIWVHNDDPGSYSYIYSALNQKTDKDEGFFFGKNKSLGLNLHSLLFIHWPNIFWAPPGSQVFPRCRGYKNRDSPRLHGVDRSIGESTINNTVWVTTMVGAAVGEQSVVTSGLRSIQLVGMSLRSPAKKLGLPRQSVAWGLAVLSWFFLFSPVELA